MATVLSRVERNLLKRLIAEARRKASGYGDLSRVAIDSFIADLEERLRRNA
jgi:hypothetical protein